MIETPSNFTPGVTPDPVALGAPLACVVREGRVLVLEDSNALAPAALAITVFEHHAERHYLGRLGSRPCWLLLVPPATAAPPGLAWQSLRALFSTAGAEELAILSRALQVAEWSLGHRFCGACGERMTDLPGERARRCGRCGFTAYPRLSPAIMVLVTRGEEILLARATRFKLPIWSALAGFVEPGESLEDTAHREVQEEVGIAITDLVYVGSQSWPFPHSLMIAFTARYAGGELQPDGTEIAEAAWYRPDSLPPLPPPASIARHLIELAAARARAHAQRHP